MKKLDIKRALSEHNMSQVELARRTGVNAPNISAIIKDGNPTIARLTKIAEGIGCDITDLFYPDPAEEAEKKEVPVGTESGGETLDTTIRGDLPEGIIERDVNFVQQPAWSEPAYPVHSDGLVSENQQQMIQTSTFCPHCGKKVRVGVVLLSGDKKFEFNVEC